jgi:hypothetical protein
VLDVFHELDFAASRGGERPWISVEENSHCRRCGGAADAVAHVVLSPLAVLKSASMGLILLVSIVKSLETALRAG